MVGRLGAALANLTLHHWNILKATLRYIAKTKNYGLIFKKRKTTGKGAQLVANCNADWANDVTDHKSTTGIYMTYNGLPLGCRSKKQSAVSQSTAEAEYRSTADALQ